MLPSSSSSSSSLSPCTLSFQTSRNRKGFVSGEMILGREKVCSVEKNAKVLVDSYKELNHAYQAATRANVKLKAELEDLQVKDSQLHTRNVELEHKVASLEKYDCLGMNARKDGNSKEEVRLEEMIHRIETNATSTSTVSLDDYKKLHGLYMAIKKKYNSLFAKHAESERDRIFLKETLGVVAKSCSPENREYIYIVERLVERRKIRYATNKEKVHRVEDTADNEESLLDHEEESASCQNPSDTPSSNTPIATEEELSAEDEDATSNDTEPVEDEKKEYSSVATKISNGDCEDSRTDDKDHKPGSFVNDQRSDSVRFYWEQDNDTCPNRSFREYFDELHRYKQIMKDFDVHPNHSSTNTKNLGKFVAFVRAEHVKLSKGDEALITAEEKEQLDNVGFTWEDRELRKRKRSDCSKPPLLPLLEGETKEATQKLPLMYPTGIYSNLKESGGLLENHAEV